MGVQVLFIFAHSMGCIHEEAWSQKVSNDDAVAVDGGSRFHSLMVLG